MYKLIKSQIWKTCSLFCHFIFLLVAFSVLLVKIYATSTSVLDFLVDKLLCCIEEIGFELGPVFIDWF